MVITEAELLPKSIGILSYVTCSSASSSAAIVLGLYTLGSVVPALMVAIRRMHDTGKSGWALLLGFIPVVGAFLVVILLAQKSEGDNRWGRKRDLDLDLEDYPEEELALPVIEFDDDYV